jgi:hypothetical protein
MLQEHRQLHVKQQDAGAGPPPSIARSGQQQPEERFQCLRGGHGVSAEQQDQHQQRWREGQPPLAQQQPEDRSGPKQQTRLLSPQHQQPSLQQHQQAREQTPQQQVVDENLMASTDDSSLLEGLGLELMDEILGPVLPDALTAFEESSLTEILWGKYPA